MAITPIDFNSAETASGNALTITTPVAAAGDFFVAIITINDTLHDDPALNITPPAGWTFLLRSDTGLVGAGTHTIPMAVYYRVATGTETPDYTWTIDIEALPIAGGIISYSGVDIVTPINASGSQFDGEVVNATAPSINVTTDNAMLVCFFGLNHNAGAFGAINPGGMNVEFDAGTGVRLRAADELLGLAAPTGTHTTNCGGATNVTGISLALNEAGSQPPVEPGIAYTLVDSTPYRLRYLLTVNPDVLAGTALPNFAGGATPNLFADSTGQPPMRALITLPVADQAGAQHVLAGHDKPPGLPTAANLVRAHCKLSPRFTTDTGTAFAVTVNEGAAAGSAQSAGFAVVIVSAGVLATNGDTAYLDIHIDHTYSQNG